MDAAALSDELNGLLRAAEKRTRGFLPPPEHLKGDPDVTSAAPGNVPNPATSSVANAGPDTPTSPAPSSPGDNTNANNNSRFEGSRATSAPPASAASATNWRLEGEALEHARQRMRHVAQARCLTKVPRLAAWFDRVDGAIQSADAAEERVESIKCRVDTLADITTKVHSHSDAISANASALMARKSRLERTLNAIAAAMKHFNLVDELMTEVSLPDLDATSARFPALLGQLEDTAVYLSRVQHYKSAKTYSSRLSMAYQRAMMALRDCIVAKVQAAAADVLASRAYTSLFRETRNAPHVGVAAMNGKPGDEDAASFERPSTIRGALERVNRLFWAKLQEVEPQLRLLEARCDATEAELFVNDCFDAYADQRARLVTPLINEYTDFVDATQEDRAGPGDVEAANIRLLLRNVADALAEERELFDTVWLSDDAPSGSFDQIAADVADAAYQRFRAALLRTDELEELAAMCAALVEYIGNRNAGDNARAPATPERPLAPELARAAPVVKRMLQDAQERIVFRTSIFIRHKIGAFPYSGDALWQDCIKAAAASTDEDAKKAAAEAAAAAAPPKAVEAAADNVAAAAEMDTAAVAATTKESPNASTTESTNGAPSASASAPSSPTIPNAEATVSSPTIPPAPRHTCAFQPLDRCIYLLDMLYPAVSAGVFAVFADECVHLTVELLARGAKLVKQAGELATTAAGNGGTGGGIAGEVSRSLPALYAQLFLVRHLLRLREALTPFDVNFTVEEKGLNVSSLVQRKLELFSRSRESKRDVETELRVACEGAIAAMRTLVAKPLSDKASSLPPKSGAAEVSDATSAAVKDSVTVAEALRSDLRGFIDAPATRTVLWKPVRAAAQQAFKDLEAAAKALHPDFVAPADAIDGLDLL